MFGGLVVLDGEGDAVLLGEELFDVLRVFGEVVSGWWDILGWFKKGF
jgi:hypothetical protein